MKCCSPRPLSWSITGPSGAALQDDRADPDDVAKDYAGKLKVAKLNIDDNQETPAKYGIRGIPTLMLFRAAMSRRPKWAPFQISTDRLH